jgi:hypothetical protein
MVLRLNFLLQEKKLWERFFKPYIVINKTCVASSVLTHLFYQLLKTTRMPHLKSYTVILPFEYWQKKVAHNTYTTGCITLSLDYVFFLNHE